MIVAATVGNSLKDFENLPAATVLYTFCPLPAEKNSHYRAKNEKNCHQIEVNLHPVREQAKNKNYTRRRNKQTASQNPLLLAAKFYDRALYNRPRIRVQSADEPTVDFTLTPPIPSPMRTHATKNYCALTGKVECQRKDGCQIRKT